MRFLLVLMLSSLLLWGQQSGGVVLVPVNGWVPIDEITTRLDSAVSNMTAEGQSFKNSGFPISVIPFVVKFEWMKSFALTKMPDTIVIRLKVNGFYPTDGSVAFRLVLCEQNGLRNYFEPVYLTSGLQTIKFAKNKLVNWVTQSYVGLILQFIVVRGGASQQMMSNMTANFLVGVYGTDSSVVIDNFGVTTGVSLKKNSVSSGFELKQNYPNPFNPSTKIGFQLEKAGNVSLKILNLLGQEVAILADGYMSAGVYEEIFQAEDLPAGVYVYMLRSGNVVATKKMVVLK